MKYLISTVTLILFFNIAFGQSNIMKGQIVEKDDWYFVDWKTYVYIDHDGYAVVKGQVKELLKEVPLARYDFGKFSEGLAYFRVNKKYGYMDTAFNVVIEPKYYDADNFKGGTARVWKSKGNDIIINTKGDKVKEYGYSYSLDHQDVSINHPTFYIYKVKEGKYELKDRSGKKQDIIVEGFLPFQEGLMAVKQNSKWGFMDSDGKMVIEPRYELAESFSGDRAAVSSDGKDKGFIDKNGSLLIGYMYEWNWSYTGPSNTSPDGFKLPPNSFSEGVTAVKKPDNGFAGFIDNYGADVSMRDDIVGSSNFHNGVAVVSVKSKSGYVLIQHDGSLVTPDEFESVVPMEEPLLWVRYKYKGQYLWHLINTKGQYQGVNSVSIPKSIDEGIVIVQQKELGDFNYVTMKGENISGSFPEAEPFKNGMARVKYISDPENYHTKVRKDFDERYDKLVKGTPEQQAERERMEELRAKQCDACLGTGVTGGGTLQCGACGGTGGTACSRCGGGGRMYNGNGESQYCSSCSGSGKKTCYTCNGSGKRKVSGFKCTKCNGTGLK